MQSGECGIPRAKCGMRNAESTRLRLSTPHFALRIPHWKRPRQKVHEAAKSSRTTAAIQLLVAKRGELRGAGGRFNLPPGLCAGLYFDDSLT